MGYFHTNKIIGMAAQPNNQDYRSGRLTLMAPYRSTTTSTRNDPRDEDEWKNQMRVFYTTLLMCTLANPQHINIQITYEGDQELLRELPLRHPRAQTQPASQPSLHDQI